MNRATAISLAMTVRGMLDEKQIGFLYDLAQKAPDGAACEVGVWRGRSYVGWALGRKNRGPLIAIDWWYGGGDVTDQLEMAELPNQSPAQIGAHRRRDFEDALKRVGLSETRIIVALSWEAAAQIGEPLAFCFIDACHETEAIRQDIASYAPIIMPGGIIVYHDYGTWKCPCIKEEVDKWQESAQWQELGQVSSCKAYRRPL